MEASADIVKPKRIRRKAVKRQMYRRYENKGLTHKEHMFCMEFFRNGGNALAAAKKAGCLSSKMMMRDKVRNFIRRKAQKLEDKINITASWKMEKLKKIIEDHAGCLNTKNASIVINAISELNKMQGDYAPTKQLTGHFVIEFSQIKQLVDSCQQEY